MLSHLGNGALHEADRWSWITPPGTLNSTQCPEIVKKKHNKQNFEVKHETSIKLTTKKFLFCKLNHYRKLFLRVRRLLALHSCIRWSHSGIGTFQLLYSFALMLVCYSLSYGQHRPILLWTMDRISRYPHYWRLLDSICLHLYTTLGNNKTICMRFIFEYQKKIIKTGDSKNMI